MAAKRILAAATYFGVALFLSISFVSFDGVASPEDVSRFANLGGSVGRMAADGLLMSFGVGAFGLSFFLLFIGYSLLTERPLGNVPVKCVGAFLVMLTIGVIFQSLRPDAGYARSLYPLGGVAGEFAADGLKQLFGTAGAAVILILAAAAGVLLATDVFVFKTIAMLPKVAAESLVALYRSMPRLAPAAAAGSDAPEAGATTGAKKTRTKKPKSKDIDAAAAPTDKKSTDADIDGITAASIDDRDEPVAASESIDELTQDAADLVSSDPDDVAIADAAAPVAKKKRARGKKKDASESSGDDDANVAKIARPEIREDDDDIDGGHGPDGLLDDRDDDSDDHRDGDDVVDDMNAADEPIDDEEPLPIPVKRAEPIIRTNRTTKNADGIEILKISRSKHLEGKEMYALPPLSLLEDHPQPDVSEREEEIRRKARRIEEALMTFGITAQVVEISRGPTITIYEMELAAGTKVKQITALADDISMALRAQTIRIVAPIPGKSTVGIEIPNEIREKVTIKELACSEILTKKHFAIPLLLGKDASGNPLIEDMASMPHLLIAGQTGSGKSVCLNSLIASVLLTKYPEEVRLVLIDPKMVELRAFREVPHLYTPVVTDMKKAPKILEWACTEMDHRYEILAAASVRDIRSFNELGAEKVKERLADHFVGDELEAAPGYMPYILVIIDELADLMMLSAKEVEGSICRLAQKSRAVGIHVILATQRPSVDVITGLIKSNMPSRISFRVASKIDSRTILDQMGAERLVGHGDMLYLPPRGSAPVRCQATLVSDREIENIVKYIKDVAQPEYSAELTEVKAPSETGGSSGAERDPLYLEAVRFVLETRRGSVSMLQRKFEIGYTRAARLVDFMAEDGIVGEFKGSKSREVIKTLEDWEKESAAAG